MAGKRHKRKFLSTFFSERKQVGAVAPSSRFLVKSMCDKIDFKSAKVIIELGPGTGVFTSELLKRANKDTKILTLELNENFYNLLKDKFQDDRLEILYRSADEITQILSERGIDKVDAILSSLPLTVIPKEIKEQIITQSFEALKEDGIYVQYQYSLSAKKLLENTFGKMKMGFVPVNMPPAFVYLGTKKS
ncbi:MAG: phosphatidylethanolamine/phosphatidyl-N-methylethanolamine N-methyltransferase [Arenicella sp.]|jgi:phosphatidylethanolamine/phosphatidyl-N-methylethanolamine N-methyltransferase